MGTLKKFRTYFLIFIAFFIVIGFLTKLAMRDNYKEITNYEIKCEAPSISVTESKATYSHGYIKGSVTNNTGKHLPLKYLQIDIYDKDGMYLGTEYKELKYFNVDETINFDINYSYNNTGKLVIDITDEMSKKESNDFFKNIDDEKLKIAAPIAGLLVLVTILP